MLMILLLATTVGADPWITGPKFAAEWDRPLTVAFENTELRDTLRKLGPERQLSLVLDRRIDPNVTVSFSMQQEPLRQGLNRLAADHAAELVVTENVAYIGPSDRARWLRTQIFQSERNLGGDSTKRPALARKTITWDDLTPPREILPHIEGAYRVKIANPEKIPHDLWAGATLPNVTMVEALALVLIQLDLSWTWEPKERLVTLVEWREPDLIERSYAPRGKATVANTLKDMQEKWPEVSITAREKDLVVRGRVEEHELIAKAQAGGGNRGGPADVAAPTPLVQRRFTLNEKNVPARAVLKELEKTGAELEFDEDSLAAAGADLDRGVTIQVQKATIDEFLRAVLSPVNATAEVNGLTITIRGKK